MVEGIARAQSDDSSAEVELRLTRIQMSGSSDLNIETVPMNRSAASVTTSDTTIEATAGLREKILRTAVPFYSGPYSVGMMDIDVPA